MLYLLRIYVGIFINLLRIAQVPSFLVWSYTSLPKLKRSIEASRFSCSTSLVYLNRINRKQNEK
jgi:hypothetical protein